MSNCTRSRYFFKNRKDRRDRVLRKMSVMRSAKARKRLENTVLLREHELVPFYPLRLGVRDKRTGDIAWIDFKSVRDAARRLSVIQKFYR